MSIGAGIGIAGAFIATSLAYVLAAEPTGAIFIAPAVAAFFIATNK